MDNWSKSLLILFFSSLIGMSSFGQEVISVQGDSYYGTNCNMDFTIGEVIVETVTNGTSELTQGFHQTNWNFVDITEEPNIGGVRIHPNPVLDYINVVSDCGEVLSYKIFNEQGAVLVEGEIDQGNDLIDLSNLSAANYYLTLKGQCFENKTVKLIKTK